VRICVSFRYPVFRALADFGAPVAAHGVTQSDFGTVVSKSGKPLYAAIEVNCGGVQRRMRSENDGSFMVRDLPDGRRCNVIASKDGERTELETDGTVPLRLVIASPLNP
jgi:hypothetical protein